MNSFRKLTDEKREIERAEKMWALEKPILERRNQLRNEQEEFKKKKQKLATSKLLVIFLFANCSLIEIFTGWATLRMLDATVNTGIIDFTPLVTLVGAIVGEVFGYTVYSLKSMKENTAGGIIYDIAMQGLESPLSPPDENRVD